MLGQKTGGRQKGTPNRTSAAMRDTILEAFDRAGGVDYLVRQAEASPQTFMALLGRILPRETKLDATVGMSHAETVGLANELPLVLVDIAAAWHDLDAGERGTLETDLMAARDKLRRERDGQPAA